MSSHFQTLIIIASNTAPNALTAEINERYDAPCLRLRGLDKALLPISGLPTLSWWYNVAKTMFDVIYIVTHAHNYERWATGCGVPVDTVVNSGFSNGGLSDVALVSRVKQCHGGVVIMNSEFLYDKSVDSGLLTHLKPTESRSYVLSCKSGFRVAIGINSESLKELHTAARNGLLLDEFLERIDDLRRLTIKDISTLGYMRPELCFSEYNDIWAHRFDHLLSHQTIHTEPTRKKAYARVGLMGNPSDGFYGKTMSLLITNFWAETILIPNLPENGSEFASITLLSHPVADPHRFSTLDSLVAVCKTDGYQHGDRLLLACCKVFYTYCEQHGIAIDTRQGFQVLFETNIPRQVGLAGSSAIITSFWKALLEFYQVTDKIPLEEQPSLVLSVEQDELGIAAGLQDRVVQTYGGLVYMDFDRSFMETHGHGRYLRLDESLLPPLFLAYVAAPEDSGKVHSTVKQRFLNGDQEVVAAMRDFGVLTDRAVECLSKRDHHGFAQLMAANFSLRRRVYGDAVVGATNIKMVEIAKRHNCVAKFPGSGGAVVGMWDGADEATRIADLKSLQEDLENEGFVFVELEAKGRQ